jgi:hypothetical protein
MAEHPHAEQTSQVQRCCAGKLRRGLKIFSSRGLPWYRGAREMSATPVYADSPQAPSVCNFSLAKWIRAGILAAAES